MVEQPSLRQLAYAAGTQRSISAAASTAGLNELEPFNSLGHVAPTVNVANPEAGASRLADAFDGGTRWKHERETWYASVVALLAVTAAALVATGVALKRYDVRRA